MSIRPLLLLIALLLQMGCNSSPTTPNTGSAGGGQPAALVGGWGRASSDYSRDVWVMRADGTGYTAQILGTRITVLDQTWSATGDSLRVKLTDPAAVARSTAYLVHADSLGIIQNSLFFNDTIWFGRQADPELVATAGEHAAALTGFWRGLLPRINLGGSSSNSNGQDTTWVPETYRFDTDGSGHVVHYSLQCDPAISDDCVTVMAPDDTTNITWWTSSSTVYALAWCPGGDSSCTMGSIVFGWSLVGDSLQLSPYNPYVGASRYGRVP